MKSYTDLPQSKKLAEFLPLESADMSWCNNSIKGTNYTDEYSANLYTIKEMQKCFDEVLNGWDKYWELIPCWSLAALLGVLPLEVETHKQTDGYKIYYYVESYMKHNRKEIYLSTERHENLVDACYEMILKLNEQNIL